MSAFGGSNEVIAKNTFDNTGDLMFKNEFDESGHIDIDLWPIQA